MNLAAFFDASVAIQIHVYAALGALALGAVVLLRPKGTRVHKTLGRIWVALMAATAVSSFWIYELAEIGVPNLFGLSPVHLLTVWTAISLPLGIWAIRTGRVRTHRITMQSLFWWALVVAGLFTLAPGRLLHQVVFGP
jgi:uncharacterized membrane protein